MSVDPNEDKGATFPRPHKAAPMDSKRQPHLVDKRLSLGRTVSLGLLEDGPEKKTNASNGSVSNLLLYKRHSAITFSESSQELDLLSLRNLQASPLSDDSGTESGNTSVDELSHSAIDGGGKADECSEVVVSRCEPDPSATQEGPDSAQLRTSESTSSVDSTPPVPLKSILRGSRQTSREENGNSISQICGSQFKAAMNRVSSDDSGIAMKPLVSMGLDLEQNKISKSLKELSKEQYVPLSNALPSPEMIGCYDSNSMASRPKKHVRLQIRSSSEATLPPFLIPEKENRLMTITSMDETNETDTVTNEGRTCDSKAVRLVAPDNNTHTSSLEKRSNTLSETESNSKVSNDSQTEQCRPTNVKLDGKKGIVEIEDIEPPRLIPVSGGILFCRQGRIEECEPQMLTPPENVVNTTELNSVPNEVVKSHEEQTSKLMEDKDVHDASKCEETDCIPVRDVVQNNSAPRSDPSDKTNETATKGKNCTIRKRNSGRRVQELVQAFDSSTKIVPSPNSKKVTSQSQSKPSKLPVSYKRTRSATVMPFTRQYAKRYTDSISNKGSKPNTEKSVVSESKPANKHQPPSPSPKPLSKRSPSSKIPLSPSQKNKGSESQRSISARRKSSPAATKPSASSDPVRNDTLRTIPRISEHEHYLKSPRPRSKCEDSSIDHDTIAKLVALSPRLQTANMKEHNRTTSLCEGVRLTGGQMKQTGGTERKPTKVVPTLDLSYSLHNTDTFNTAKRARSKPVSVSNGTGNHPSKTLRKPTQTSSSITSSS